MRTVETLARSASFLGCLLVLAALATAPPALSQNLLVNSGFDRDLSGWTVATDVYPSGRADVHASAAWSASDVHGNAQSGSADLNLAGPFHTGAWVSLSQCVPARPLAKYVARALVRIDRQLNRTARVNLGYFDGVGCTGNELYVADLTRSDAVTPSPGEPSDSAGAWLPTTASGTAPEAARSVYFAIESTGPAPSPFTFSFDGALDDAFLAEGVAAWTLPSAGRGAGATGSLWTTTLTLANPGADDALVALKFLGHDADGRSGSEKTVFVRAGGLLEYPDVLGTLFGWVQNYGAIRITSSSPSLVVQSETSTPSFGGTVGQALPAFGPADYAGVTPKSLAPIRENESFRTNLVLANATEIPVIAHVVLYASEGAQIGARDVDLPSLGMTQINRVGSALGAASLDAGRIAVSTTTPGGLVAAYASVIDNVTNDPRTLLPR